MNGRALIQPKGTMTVEELKEVLAANPEMLERYVLETVSLETLEKWMQRKAEILNLPTKPFRGKNKLAKWKVRNPKCFSTEKYLSFNPVLRQHRQEEHVGGPHQ